MDKKTNSVRSLLERSKTCAFVPKGTSMWPFLKNKKQTVIISREVENINLYDVIFYTTKDGREVLHRVINLTKDGYETCGDALKETEFVKKENVFGVMQGYYKGKKLISAKDEKYLIRVDKWYKNSKKRQRKIKRYRLRVKIKNKIKNVIKGTKK